MTQAGSKAPFGEPNWNEELEMLCWTKPKPLYSQGCTKRWNQPPPPRQGSVLSEQFRHPKQKSDSPLQLKDP